MANGITIWEDMWAFGESSAWNPSSNDHFRTEWLQLKGADEANLEVENPEEGSSNAAVIATSSIFGLTLCAYFVYKKCMEMKQITDDFQRA